MMTSSWILSVLLCGAIVLLHNGYCSESRGILFNIPSNMKDRLDWHTKMESCYGMIYKFRTLLGRRMLEAGIEEYVAASESHLTMSSHYIAMFRELIMRHDADCGIYNDVEVLNAYEKYYYEVFYDIVISLHADFVDLMCAIFEWKTLDKHVRTIDHPLISAWFESRGFTEPLTQLKSVDVDDVVISLRNLIGPDQPLCNLLNCMGLRKATMYPTDLGEQLAWLHGFSDQLNSDDVLYQCLYSKIEEAFPGEAEMHVQALKRPSTHGNSLITMYGKCEGPYIHPKNMNLWEVVYFFPAMIDRYFDILVSFVPDMMRELRELADVCAGWETDISCNDEARNYLSSRGIDATHICCNGLTLSAKIKELSRESYALDSVEKLIYSYNKVSPSASARGAAIRDNRIPENGYVPLSKPTGLKGKAKTVDSSHNGTRHSVDLHAHKKKCESVCRAKKNGGHNTPDKMSSSGSPLLAFSSWILWAIVLFC